MRRQVNEMTYNDTLISCLPSNDCHIFNGLEWVIGGSKGRKLSIYECVGITFHSFLLMKLLFLGCSDVMYLIFDIMLVSSLSLRIKRVHGEMSRISATLYLEIQLDFPGVHFNGDTFHPIIREEGYYCTIGTFLSFIAIHNGFHDDRFFSFQSLKERNILYIEHMYVSLKKTHESVNLKTLQCAWNQEFNRKLIIMNLVTVELVINLCPQMKHFIENYDGSHVVKIGNTYERFITNNMLMDVFPCSSTILNLFGHFHVGNEVITMSTLNTVDEDDVEKRTIIMMQLGAIKRCKYCGNAVTLHGRQGKLQYGAHFSKSCLLAAVNDESVIQHDVNKRIYEFIRNFDRMVISCNDFVKEHKIIEKLRDKFPFLSFPNTYMECLFYSDGTGYRIMDNGMTTSMLRSQIVINYPNECTNLLDKENMVQVL